MTNFTLIVLGIAGALTGLVSWGFREDIANLQQEVITLRRDVEFLQRHAAAQCHIYRDGLDPTDINEKNVAAFDSPSVKLKCPK